MKKLCEKKIKKLIDNHIDGILIETNARQLKIARNTAKKYLREHNLLGPSDQMYSTNLTSPNLYESNPYNAASDNDDTSSPDQRIGLLVAELQRAWKDNSDQFDLYLKVVRKFGNLQRENEQLIQNNTELTTINQELTKKVTEQEQVNETQKEQHKREQEEQKTKYVQEIQTINQQHQLKLNQQKTKHDQEIDTIKRQHRCDLDEQKNKITTIQREDNEVLQKLKDKLDLSNKINKEIIEEKNKLKQEELRLNAKQKTAPIKYGGVGLLIGTGVGILGTLGYQWFLKITSRSTLPPNVETGKNTRHNAIPNPDKGMIQPSINSKNSWVNSAGIRYIELGKGFGIAIPAILQKYIRQT
ncbi:Uncharacterised protein [uncultured archaeon]|nr:Uncharacterised protein [uncultured archaeon]